MEAFKSLEPHHVPVKETTETKNGPDAVGEETNWELGQSEGAHGAQLLEVIARGAHDATHDRLEGRARGLRSVCRVFPELGVEVTCSEAKHRLIGVTQVADVGTGIH